MSDQRLPNDFCMGYSLCLSDDPVIGRVPVEIAGMKYENTIG